MTARGHSCYDCGDKFTGVDYLNGSYVVCIMCSVRICKACDVFFGLCHNCDEVMGAKEAADVAAEERYHDWVQQQERQLQAEYEAAKDSGEPPFWLP